MTDETRSAALRPLLTGSVAPENNPKLRGEDVVAMDADDPRWNALAYADEFHEILQDVFKTEGVELWLAHADKQGWPYEERLQRALNLTEGNFS